MDDCDCIIGQESLNTGNRWGWSVMIPGIVMQRKFAEFHVDEIAIQNIFKPPLIQDGDDVFVSTSLE